MSDGAKSWVGDTHEPSPRAAGKDHGTKRRLPFLTSGVLIWPGSETSPWPGCWIQTSEQKFLSQYGSPAVFVAAPWRSTWVMPPSAVWDIWRPGWLEIQSVSLAQSWSSGSFSGHFLDGKRWGSSVLKWVRDQERVLWAVWTPGPRHHRNFWAPVRVPAV